MSLTLFGPYLCKAMLNLPFSHLSVTSSLENFHSRYENELCPFGHHLVCHVIGTQELKELVFSVTKPSMIRRHHPVPAATASL